MPYKIVLNKREKTLKVVYRKNNIRLQHSGTRGPIGNTGPSGTVSVGSTTTLNPGSNATVTNTGAPTAAILNFGIPEGIQGDTPLAIQPEAPAETDWLWVDTDDDGHDVYAEIDRVEGLLDTHAGDTSNPHSVTKTQVGLSNVDNTSDISKPVSSATQAALSNKADLVGGKVPESQLPSFVDDVLTYPNLASFPATGENGKIYITEDTNLTYRWSGSNYTEISPSLALGETSSTAYRGDRGKTAYDHSLRTDNPHGVTKAQVGLGNVDNTSDMDKPVSTATQAALDGKVEKASTANIVYGRNSLNQESAIPMSDTAADAYSIVRRSAGGVIVTATPTVASHATTKAYVDTAGALKVNKAGDTMSGQLITLDIRPTTNNSYQIGTSVNSYYELFAGRLTLGTSGSPTILKGTGFPNGVVTAPVGSIYIDTAVTNGASSWIKKSGTGNTGWTVLEGDTGWRNITSLLDAGSYTGGTVTIRKVGIIVQLEIVGLTPTTSNQVILSDIITKLGIAFAPIRVSTTMLTGYATPNYNRSFIANPSGGGGFKINGFSSAVNDTADYTSIASWPTTLPGTAV